MTLQRIDKDGGHTQLYPDHPDYGKALATQINLGKPILELTTEEYLEHQITALESAIDLYQYEYNRKPTKLIRRLQILRHADLQTGG